jgi:Patatin-like phospholipase
VAQSGVSTTSTTLPALDQPATYPLRHELTQDCDLVMKGGITSGVIYPRAVCQLAVTRRLHQVGGTSAGAIAAAAAAAAEYARDAGAGPGGSPDVGYPRLAKLPHTLAHQTGRHTQLFHLFQPQRCTAALYRLASVWIGRGSIASKLRRSIIPALRAVRPKPALVLGLLAMGLAMGVALAHQFSNCIGVTFAVLLWFAGVVVGLAVAVAWSLYIRVLHDLRDNHFGLCSGMRTPGSDLPALTEFLTTEFNQIANQSSGGPLTFGDLESRDITLKMLTTDLSLGTQNQLPFSNSIWGFCPTEFADLFPGTVVQWLKDHSPDPAGSPELEQLRAAGKWPLPAAEHLPVIVGVRMSLSFPGLLSTVPLHAIDHTSPADPQTGLHPIVCHRFADGGITSNFPLHFFDAAVPQRPTFGIDLVKVDHLSPNPARMLSMSARKDDGILSRPVTIKTVGGFVGALLNTMQNWADNMQALVPGYRDRIVAVEHTKVEGGMNLDMPRRIITDLAERGRCAGLETNDFNFTNHRWIRFRSLLQTLEDLIERARTPLQGPGPDGAPSYDQMINGTPPSYRSGWDDQTRAAFTDVKAAVVALGDTYAQVNGVISDDAPKPEPRLQVRPRPRT